MGKPKKKKSGGGEGKQKLGRRKQLQLEKQQKEENERKAEAAIEAGLKKLEERGITEDSDMFAPIPTKEDCPICLVPLPVRQEESIHMECCGKIICTACNDANEAALKKIDAGRETKKQPPLHSPCAFCRTATTKSKKEVLHRLMKLVESNDDVSMMILADRHKIGRYVEQDSQRAFDLTLRAVELGNATSFVDLGVLYSQKKFLETDMAKMKMCMEASARAGNFMAHFNLGNFEHNNGNYALALKHYHVTAAAGYKPALDKIQNMHKEKRASYDDFLRAIQAYKKAIEEQSSDERTEWAEKKKKKANSST